jgi:hypothetical protein
MLKFFRRHVAPNSPLEIVDYEQLILSRVGSKDYAEREQEYLDLSAKLVDTLSGCFDATDIRSLSRVSDQSDHGSQVAKIYTSIASSVDYPQLRAIGTEADAQALYRLHISCLLDSMDELKSGMSPLTRRQTIATVRDMRQTAFEAACRYAAISLTDRSLGLLDRCFPKHIKLTVHPKPGEVHILTSSAEGDMILAQHATGGLERRKGRLKPSFRYYVERGHRGDCAITLGGSDEGLGNEAQDQSVAINNERYIQPVGFLSSDLAHDTTPIHRMILESDLF